MVLILEFFQFKVVKFVTCFTHCLFHFYNKQIIMSASLVYDYIGKYCDWIRLRNTPNAQFRVNEAFVSLQSFWIIKVSIVFTIHMPFFKKKLQVYSKPM